MGSALRDIASVKASPFIDEASAPLIRLGLADFHGRFFFEFPWMSVLPKEESPTNWIRTSIGRDLSLHEILSNSRLDSFPP